MASALRHSPSLAAPPTNARGTPRRPPKLRSSCDACGAAKVRCDKTQPRCGRCVAGGLTCVYGLSRKFGKAPRKKPPVDTSIATDALPRPLAQHAHQSHQTHQAHQRQHQHQHQPSSLSSYGADMRHLSSAVPRPLSLKYEPTPMSPYGLDHSLMAMAGGYGGHEDLFLRSPATMDSFEDPFSFADAPTSAGLGPDPRSTVDPLDLTFPSSSDFQSYADWVQPEDLMHSPATSHDADTAPSLSSISRTASLDSLSGYPESLLMGGPSSLEAAAAPQQQQQQQQQHNCNKLAYATLESLSFRHETLAAQGEPRTQTMDKVLNRNKQAVHTMHQLLQCPCAKSPHMAMLYASIVSKALMWYQLAAGGAKPSSSSSSAGTTTTLSWDYMAALGHQPTPPLSASSSPSLAFVQPRSPVTGTGTGAGAGAAGGAGAEAVQASQFVVTPMQFSVGAFSVDDESAQEALRKQLLLSELKKAGHLIDLLSMQGRDELATGEVNDVYSALGTWLRCELNRTISSLKS